MSNERLSDAIGDVNPDPTEFPTPDRIKPGSATVVAMAVIEDDLDVSLMDDAFWVSLWRERGVTRLAKLVWALVNQHRLADDEEPIWTERDVQSRIDANSLHAYLLAALRAYGQEDFADALEETLSRPKSDLANAPTPPGDAQEDAPRPTPAVPDPPTENAA